MRYQKKNWKYHLPEPVTLQTQIYPEKTLTTEWITLTPSGKLTLAKGYCWDGASGPAVDTPSFMRGSAVHDALCQLIKLGLLAATYFAEATRELLRWCKRDGMWSPRRAWVRWAVDEYGRNYMNDDSDTKIYTAGPV